MNALPGPLLLTTRRTANLLARYCALASSSPDAPEMFFVGSAAAFCCAVAAASADAIAAPTSASTAAPQAYSAAWMRAWSGLAVVALTATPTPETDGSASGGSAPSGRLTSLLLASSVAQTCVSAGSAGSAGRFASVLVVPTWKALPTPEACSAWALAVPSLFTRTTPPSPSESALPRSA